MYKAIHICVSELRRSGRVRSKQLVIEENIIDDPIDADVENNDDDFQPERNPNQETPGSSGKHIKAYVPCFLKFVK